MRVRTTMVARTNATIWGARGTSRGGDRGGARRETIRKESQTKTGLRDKVERPGEIMK